VAVKNSSSAEPFVVGVFCGKSKPASVEAFLADFVFKINTLLTDGIELADDRFAVTVHDGVKREITVTDDTAAITIKLWDDDADCE